MLKRLVRMIGGDPNQKKLQELAEQAEFINSLEPQFEALSLEDDGVEYFFLERIQDSAGKLLARDREDAERGIFRAIDAGIDAHGPCFVQDGKHQDHKGRAGGKSGRQKAGGNQARVPERATAQSLK